MAIENIAFYQDPSFAQEIAKRVKLRTQEQIARQVTKHQSLSPHTIHEHLGDMLNGYVFSTGSPSRARKHGMKSAQFQERARRTAYILFELGYKQDDQLIQGLIEVTEGKFKYPPTEPLQPLRVIKRDKKVKSPYANLEDALNGQWALLKGPTNHLTYSPKPGATSFEIDPDNSYRLESRIVAQAPVPRPITLSRDRLSNSKVNGIIIGLDAIVEHYRSQDHKSYAAWLNEINVTAQ